MLISLFCPFSVEMEKLIFSQLFLYITLIQDFCFCHCLNVWFFCPLNHQVMPIYRITFCRKTKTSKKIDRTIKKHFLIGYFGSCPLIHVVTGHHWLLIVQNISNLNPFSTPTFKVMNYMSSFFGSKIQLLKHELSPINGGYAAPETMSPPP